MTKIRDWYEKTFIPLGRILAKTGLSPNQITISSVLVGLVQIYFFWKNELLLGLFFFILAAFMDILDGSLARAMGKVSAFGQLLDHFSDRIVEFELIFGLILGGYIPGWLGAILTFSMIMPSYVRARGEAVSGISGQGIGFFERKEKLGTLMIGIVLERWFGGSIFFAGVVVSILSFITAIQRMIYYRRKINIEGTKK